jgi:WD40 repeat protein
MQYNKPGNFAVGSSSLDTLRAVADHRIPRPIVASSENADNAQDSMRQTQDPWLYTSVVSSSYCEVNGYTFTASFDHTVRVWKVAENGSSIDLRGTWPHDGKVNFVVSSSHHERLATASDVSNNAIRVYNLEEEDISNSRPDFYSGEKAIEQSQELFRRDKWAYHPATIQWGKAPGVADFLLVGYSPRSETGHDVDIPEDKKNTGELCLWNVEAGTRIPISSARTQNVFEVMWHPTQPCFLAATSPCGTFEPETKTQIRLFAQNEFGSWLHIKALDCPASDINELTIMSVVFFYGILRANIF